jgi:hypothetical protein
VGERLDCIHKMVVCFLLCFPCWHQTLKQSDISLSMMACFLPSFLSSQPIAFRRNQNHDLPFSLLVMHAYYYDNEPYMPFVFLPCSSSTSSLLTSSFTWSRTDQRLPHNSGEPVSPDELTRLGLVYYHIPVEGEWEEGVGAFSLHFYCPLCLAITE